MTDVISLAKEYLELREKNEEIKKRMNQIKAVLQKEVAEKGNLQVDDKEFTLKKRLYYDYDIDKAKEILGDKFSLVAKTVIDKGKISGLIKGGFITKDEIEAAKVITKEVTALVVEDIKK